MLRRLRITQLLDELLILVEAEPLIPSDIKVQLRSFRLKTHFSISAGMQEDPASDVPKKAPANWLDRKDKSETPVDFIKREYREWLGKGLSKSDVRRLIGACILPFTDGSRRWYLAPDFILPTKREVNDAELSKAGFTSGELAPNSGRPCGYIMSPSGGVLGRHKSPTRAGHETFASR